MMESEAEARARKKRPTQEQVVVCSCQPVNARHTSGAQCFSMGEVAAFMREHRTLKTPGHARSLMYIESFAPKTPLIHRFSGAAMSDPDRDYARRIVTAHQHAHGPKEVRLKPSACSRCRDLIDAIVLAFGVVRTEVEKEWRARLAERDRQYIRATARQEARR